MMSRCWLLAVGLLALFSGCAEEQASASSPEAVIRNATYDAYHQISALKAEFPLLLKFDKSILGTYGFQYSAWETIDKQTVHGFIAESHRALVTISFGVTYPLPEEPIQISDIEVDFSLENGKTVRYIRQVEAEDTDEGRRLVERINTIIDEVIEHLNEELSRF